MTAGLQVIGDNGTAQIDENYQNYHLVQSFQLAQGDNWSNMISGTRLSPNAVWAMYVTQGLSCPSPGTYITGSGRQFKYWFMLGGAQVKMQAYVFDVLPPTGVKYGLEVYNASGVLVYDGQGYPMRVIEPVSWEGTGSRPAPPQGRTFAVSPLFGGRRVQDDGQGADYESWSMYIGGGGTGSWSYNEQYLTGPGSGVPIDYGTAGFYGLMLDVTDIPLNYLRIPA